MAYNRNYYLKHKEKYLEATKKYIAKKRAENNEEWLEKQNEYMKEYYAKNPDQKNKKMNMIRSGGKITQIISKTIERKS